MIARLSGILIEKSVTQCVVDVHGAGYRVCVPLSTFYELPEMGQPVVIHVHTHVREDAIHLYGFHTPEEREVFQMMISVSGIGPEARRQYSLRHHTPGNCSGRLRGRI